MKTMVLAADIWHSAESIKPMVDLLYPEHNCLFTTDPADFLKDEYDLLINFKDPIENNQIPTPTWADDTWTDTLLSRVCAGMGAVIFHAGMADLPGDHPMVRELIHGTFLFHPAQCPVSFEPIKEHPVLSGISAFTLPEPDEHYHIGMLPGTEGEIIGETVSEHGRQPGLWIHEYGKGRVCMFTPGHVTPNLTDPNMIAVFRNMIRWCLHEM